MFHWYELAGQASHHMVDLGATLPPHQKSIWDFYVQYTVDALSPSNYFLTNPQALQKTAASKGQSFLTGPTRMLEDLQKNALPASTDMEAFTVGVNLAMTLGSVV